MRHWVSYKIVCSVIKRFKGEVHNLAKNIECTLDSPFVINEYFEAIVDFVGRPSTNVLIFRELRIEVSVFNEMRECVFNVVNTFKEKVIGHVSFIFVTK